MVPKSNGRSSRPASARASAPAAPPTAAAVRREQERRRSILRAAATTFRRRGFAATGMRDIAREADLSAANLYYYFPSKGSLLTYCQDRSLDRMLAACREARALDGAAVRLEHVLRSHLRCTLDEMDGAAAHLEVDELPDGDRERIVAKRDRYERAVRKLVEEGIASGSFVPCDAKLVTRAILGALNWTARWYDPSGPTSRDDLEGAYAGYLLRGLAAR